MLVQEQYRAGSRLGLLKELVEVFHDAQARLSCCGGGDDPAAVRAALLASVAYRAAISKAAALARAEEHAEEATGEVLDVGPQRIRADVLQLVYTLWHLVEAVFLRTYRPGSGESPLGPVLAWLRSDVLSVDDTATVVAALQRLQSANAAVDPELPAFVWDCAVRLVVWGKPRDAAKLLTVLATVRRNSGLAQVAAVIGAVPLAEDAAVSAAAAAAAAARPSSDAVRGKASDASAAAAAAAVAAASAQADWQAWQTRAASLLDTMESGAPWEAITAAAAAAAGTAAAGAGAASATASTGRGSSASSSSSIFSSSSIGIGSSLLAAADGDVCAAGARDVLTVMTKGGAAPAQALATIRARTVGIPAWELPCPGALPFLSWADALHVQLTYGAPAALLGPATSSSSSAASGAAASAASSSDAGADAGGSSASASAAAASVAPGLRVIANAARRAMLTAAVAQRAQLAASGISISVGAPGEGQEDYDVVDADFHYEGAASAAAEAEAQEWPLITGAGLGSGSAFPPRRAQLRVLHAVLSGRPAAALRMLRRLAPAWACACLGDLLWHAGHLTAAPAVLPPWNAPLRAALLLEWASELAAACEPGAPAFPALLRGAVTIAAAVAPAAVASPASIRARRAFARANGLPVASADTMAALAVASGASPAGAALALMWLHRSAGGAGPAAVGGSGSAGGPASERHLMSSLALAQRLRAALGDAAAIALQRRLITGFVRACLSDGSNCGRFSSAFTWALRDHALAGEAAAVAASAEASSAAAAETDAAAAAIAAAAASAATAAALSELDTGAGASAADEALTVVCLRAIDAVLLPHIAALLDAAAAALNTSASSSSSAASATAFAAVQAAETALAPLDEALAAAGLSAPATIVRQAARAIAAARSGNGALAAGMGPGASGASLALSAAVASRAALEATGGPAPAAAAAAAELAGGPPSTGASEAVPCSCGTGSRLVFLGSTPPPVEAAVASSGSLRLLLCLRRLAGLAAAAAEFAAAAAEAEEEGDAAGAVEFRGAGAGAGAAAGAAAGSSDGLSGGSAAAGGASAHVQARAWRDAAQLARSGAAALLASIVACAGAGAGSGSGASDVPALHQPAAMSSAIVHAQAGGAGGMATDRDEALEDEEAREADAGAAAAAAGGFAGPCRPILLMNSEQGSLAIDLRSAAAAFAITSDGGTALVPARLHVLRDMLDQLAGSRPLQSLPLAAALFSSTSSTTSAASIASSRVVAAPLTQAALFAAAEAALDAETLAW